MHIENIAIQNYRSLRRAELRNLSRLTVVVGANGSGKSTLFDVFAFLKDAVIHNVGAAVARRGGFRELVSRGSEGPIEITVQFRENGGRLATYVLEVADRSGRVVVTREVLRYRRGSYGKPWRFVDFSNGEGYAIINESDYGQKCTEDKREEFKLDDPSALAIKELGQFRRFQVVADFRHLIENWHVADARRSGGAGYGKHLSARGHHPDSKMHPLLAVEAPESHLYPDLLPDLVDEFRDYARRGNQVFVSTYSPLFLNEAELNEVFWLVKQDGFTEVRRAADQQLLKGLVDEGDKLGKLWSQGLFDGAWPDPRRNHVTPERNRSDSFQAMLDGIDRFVAPVPYSTTHYTG